MSERVLILYSDSRPDRESGLGRELMDLQAILGALERREIDPEAAHKAIAHLAESASHVLNDSQERIAADLVQSLAGALYCDEAALDRTRPFIELGLDSIVGVEWLRDINARYRTEIAATKLYEFSTVESLAGLVAEEVSRLAPRPEAINPVRPYGYAQEQIASVSESKSPKLSSALGGLDGGSRPIGGMADAIAIVGMSGRYPGAQDLGEYWSNLSAGRNSIVEVPRWRWEASEYYEGRRPGQKISCKWLGALSDIECFDPLFFNISPIEAELMDPQQRLFLQESYHAFEDAGY
jgi:polyketide synthase PksN